MNESFYHRLQSELDKRREEHLLRQVRPWDGCGLDLSSNDYLCLRRHPRVIEGASAALRDFGSGSGASPLITGYLPCHDGLIRKLLSWKKKEAGMLFNTGYMANQAVILHLPGKRDLILADRLIHHSMAQALTRSPAAFKRYDHLDLAHLERLLASHHAKYQTVFVVTESVFSMDGDYPDLQGLVALKKKYPFILILDEAHGTGVFGPTGGGLAEEMNVLEHVDIFIGTLGKSLASMGAYVLSSRREAIDYLINYAGELIYSTYLGPAQVGAADSAVDLVRSSSDRREHLRAISLLARKLLNSSGRRLPEIPSPILPVIIGDERAALTLQQKLAQHGYRAAAVRPPAVPAGTSRLRISLHAGVTEDQVREICGLLKA